MRLAYRLALVAAFLVLTAPAIAQDPWSVFVGAGAVGFGGASQVTTPPLLGEATQYKPAPTTRLHLGVARSFGKGGITFDAAYAKSGLGAYTESAHVSFSPALTLYDLRLLGSYAIAAIGQGSLKVGIGPMLQLWSGEAITNTQTRLGAAASATLSAPLSRRFGVLVAASMGVAASPFDQQTLDDNGLEAATAWTRELGVALQFRL